MSWGELFLKSGSSTFTGYFLIVSIAFILYGVFTTTCILKTNSVETLEEELVALPALSLILFGIILLVLIILGCCSVCREVPCCLEGYSVLLAILAATQIAMGIFCLIRFHAYNAQLAEKMLDEVTKMYLKYDENPEDLDSTQEWLGCCGVTDAFNWMSNNRTLPLTCCEDTLEECTISSTTRYREGCAFLVFSYVTTTNYVIGWSLIIVAVTEIIAAMMGISLSCAFWRNSRVMWI